VPIAIPGRSLANKRRIAFGKAWKRRNCVAKSAKPLIVIQRVQIPPDQSRADRSVVSLAIHRATGGVRSVDNKVAGREDSVPKSCIVARHDVFASAEGSIWWRPLLRGRAGTQCLPIPLAILAETTNR